MKQRSRPLLILLIFVKIKYKTGTKESRDKEGDKENK
jgi:hypothetical protein